MQALDLPCNPPIDPSVPDPSAMSENSSPIHSPNGHSSKDNKTHVETDTKNENSVKNSSSVGKNNYSSSVVVRRRGRPGRAHNALPQGCRLRPRRRQQWRRKRERGRRPLLNIKVEFSAEELETALMTRIILWGCTYAFVKGRLVVCVVMAKFSKFDVLWRWAAEMEAVISGFKLAWPVLSETCWSLVILLFSSYSLLFGKAIPPVTRMALGHNTWVTVLCRKLRDWWHWVAEGDLPIVASHGAEVEAYNTLDPGVRVVILKALCDIRVEQEDIRNYIDESLKHGVHLSAFRKERIGGDSHGISYWYEDDPIIGHRLYREIRKVEVKKGKGKTVPPIPHSSYQWEAVATNLDEFLNVSDKLFSSKNRTEVSVGKKLKNDMLPEIEKVHKRKEKLLKKQHRQALMLDGIISMDGLAAGRSLRDRKPVTYTFDDYDRSINEAIKVTKKKLPSPEPSEKRDPHVKIEDSTNGRWGGPSQYPRHDSFSALSPDSPDDDDFYDDQKTETLERSNRRRQKPQRYSVNEFVEAVSDNDADFDSDDDIVGEVVYDDEYLRRRKRAKKTSSSSEGEDEEYQWDEENPEEEEEEEEEEEDDDGSSTGDESDAPRKFKPSRGRTRRETKLRSVDELQSGLRRSKRSTRNRINYKQYEMSESEPESLKFEKPNELDDHSDASENPELSTGSHDSEENVDKNEMPEDNNQPPEEHPPEIVENKQTDPAEESNDPPEELNSREQEGGGVKKTFS
ncbi:hypothetical protein DH2020_043234 [Rehmannia glutinosa]|uniref:WHIM1 domain-containing protein n=1 Tax=Rehmannia glutinosa TaxID=99300 RepID=A0ABR0UL33_REHGL